MRQNEETFCVCKKPAGFNRFMISCDKCSEWFHGSCVSIKKTKIPDKWLCPVCVKSAINEEKDCVSKADLEQANKEIATLKGQMSNVLIVVKSLVNNNKRKEQGANEKDEELTALKAECVAKDKEIRMLQQKCEEKEKELVSQINFTEHCGNEKDVELTALRAKCVTIEKEVRMLQQLCKEKENELVSHKKHCGNKRDLDIRDLRAESKQLLEEKERDIEVHKEHSRKLEKEVEALKELYQKKDVEMQKVKEENSQLQVKLQLMKVKYEEVENRRYGTQVVFNNRKSLSLKNKKPLSQPLPEKRHERASE